jgi:hypothetical protein
MPKSRTDLIKEITQARNDAKSNMLYVKGLTKMKITELKQIHADLKIQHSKKQKYDDDSDSGGEQEAMINDDVKLLEEERDRIKREIDQLETQEENHKTELDELDEDMDNVKNGNDDEYLEEERDNEALQPMRNQSHSEKQDKIQPKQPIKEQKQPMRNQSHSENQSNPKELEKEVRMILKEFSKNVKELLSDYNKNEIDDDVAEYIINFHNEQKNIIKNDLEEIYSELGDDDFNDNFYNFIDKSFETVLKLVDNKINLR